MSSLAISSTGLSALAKIILFGNENEFLTPNELTIVKGESKLKKSKVPADLKPAKYQQIKTVTKRENKFLNQIIMNFKTNKEKNTVV